MQLQLESITKEVRGEPHLYEMSLHLAPGMNVLLGPTTAGKTSLMRLMAGLDHPTSGQILVDKQDVTGQSVKERNVAFVYQQFINYPSLTVFENIASPLRVRGSLRRQVIKERVEHVAELMQIAPMLQRLPAELSGGQQQRTAIARALIKESPLLLLDEPLVNLDYKLREELRAEMQNIFASQNAIVVYSTTEPLEALMLGGTTFVLDAGKLLQSGPTLSVYHQPISQRAGQVFSDPPMNLLKGRIRNQVLALAEQFQGEVPGHMAKLEGEQYDIGVRANHVTLAPTSAADIAIPLYVELAEISGSETFIYVRTTPQANPSQQAEQEDSLRLVAQLAGVHQYEPGQAVTIYLNPARLFAFAKAGQLAAAPDYAIRTASASLTSIEEADAKEATLG